MPNASGEMTVEPDESAVATLDDDGGAGESQPGVLALLGRTLLFSTEPYAIVRDDDHPGRRGFVIVLVVVAIVAVAQMIAYWLGWLTAPRLDSLQGLLYSTVTDWPWYAEQVQQDPAFATQFQQGYLAGWEALRILLGYPTLTATISVDLSLIVTTFGNWFLFAVLAHWTARWFGSQARFGQTLGTVALAYAPLLLLVIQVVPGATVPLSLLFLLMLATKYLALKTTHNLGTPQTLFVLAAPYVIVAIVAALVALYGGAYGLEQLPYFRDAFKVQLFLAR
ncbi:MAG: YIP1 family protein [Caldilinea sp.]|nr:YIP1 family protein [Caldilinea sp.]